MMIRYYWKVLKNYAEFDGRASRSEYWYFTLADVIILSMLLAGNIMIYESGILLYIAYIYKLATFIPSIAVGFRRMQDKGSPGWCFFIPLLNLIFLIRKGDIGSNKYGTDPKLKMK